MCKVKVGAKIFIAHGCDDVPLSHSRLRIASLDPLART